MKYHFIRMLNHEREISRKLFEDDYISIGYSKLNKDENGKEIDYVEEYNSSENKYEKIREDVKKKFEKWGTHSKFEKFLNIEVGDIVIVPDYKCFYITEVIEKPISYIGELKRSYGDGDIGVVCKIKKISNSQGIVAKRELYAHGDLAKKLRSLGGYYELKADNIEKIKRDFENEKVIKIEEEFKSALRNKVLEIIKTKLNPNNIERFIKNLMEKTGAKCDIPAKNNKKNATTEIADVDITCVYEKIKHIIYIQVKKHEGETSEYGVEQLQEYNDTELDQDYSTSYWLITTGEISEKARESQKKSKKVIRLIDGNELADMILEIGIDSLEVNNI